MEFLTNVLIKEVDGAVDKVVYVDNLPKDFLYRRVKKMMIDPYDPQQRIVPEYEMVDGRKVPTNAMTEELLPGVEISPTGDEAYVFFTAYNEAKQRLGDIDRYIKANVPVTERIQERIPYAMQRGVMTSGPIPLRNIPRVVLPAPVSPPASAVHEGIAHTAALPAQKKIRRPMTEAQKVAARERLAKAREIRRAQQVGDIKA